MTDKEISLDIQEINLDTSELTTGGVKEINIDKVNGSTDSMFGGGIELLMNERIKSSHSTVTQSSSGSMQKELDDLNELNDMSIDNLPLQDESFKKKDSFKNKPVFEIAKGTAKLDDISESWDGFKEINTSNIEDINIKSSKLNEKDLLREKFEILRKLDSLESKGATLSKKYDMDCELDEMKGEYEFLINEKERQNAVKFQGKVLTTMITGLEFLNSKFDPFDIKLDGWSEQLTENVDDFDEIFAELHDKYKSKAKMAPELKLLFQLASSGIMIHMTNTMFKSALPGMDDIMRQNPDLMNQFTKAAMGSMEQSSPGLSNFMNDFGNQSGPPPPSGQNRKVSESYNTQQNQEMRGEMKGPATGNIDSLLANMNNKNIVVDNESTISVDEINSLGASRKTKGRRKSDKGTISLAI
jgi:hypothetical protein